MAPLKIRGLRGVRLLLLLPPTLLLGVVVVEIIPGVSVAGMLAVVGGVDVERVAATMMVAMAMDVLEDEVDRSILAMSPVNCTALFCWRRIW